MLLTFEEDEAGRCERAEETPPCVVVVAAPGVLQGHPKKIPEPSFRPDRNIHLRGFYHLNCILGETGERLSTRSRTFGAPAPVL